MEATGLVIGIVGLFSTCMDILNRYETFKEADWEQIQVYTRLEGQKLRLERWGKVNGCSASRLQEYHNPALDAMHTQRFVRDLLVALGDALDPGNERILKLRNLVGPHVQTFDSGPHDQRDTGNEKVRRTVPRSKRLAWAFGRGERSAKFVDDVTSLVDLLYQVVDGDEQAIAPLRRRATDLDGVQRHIHNAASAESLIDEMYARWAKEDDQAVLRWLGVEGLDQRYEEAVSDRLDGTCQWIEEVDVFRNWVSDKPDNERSKLLWIHGPPGSGKTILCAHIVEMLREDIPASLAYSFSSGHQPSITPDVAIRRWLAQLYRTSAKHRRTITEHVHPEAAKTASHADLWAAFEATVTRDGTCTLVLDGLDEYDRADEKRQLFLQKLRLCAAKGRCQILVVSRDNADIRRGVFSGGDSDLDLDIFEYKITVENVRADVSKFAADIVRRKLPTMAEGMQATYVKRMASKADGMFLAIKFHERHLRATMSSREIKHVISDTPGDLSQVYESSRKHINDHGPRDRERVGRILAWTRFSLKPLCVGELTEVLDNGIPPQETGIQPTDLDEDLECDFDREIDDRYIENEIIDLCGSLVKTRVVNKLKGPASHTLHLTHFSVQEYLNSIASGPRAADESWIDFLNEAKAHLYLAKACLCYMLTAKVWERGLQDKDDGNSAFLAYAISSWHRHAQEASKDDKLRDLILKFLTPRSQHFDSWSSQFESLGAWVDPRNSHMNKQIPPPSYYAALFGFVSTMTILREERGADFDTVAGRYGSALQATCVSGHRGAFETLLLWGVKINTQGGEYGTAINAAATLGRGLMVTRLLRAGADTSLRDPDGKITIHIAALQGHAHIVKSLLLSGCDARMSNSSGWTLLNIAANHGYCDVMRTLMEHGADPTIANSDGATPLYTAARNGHLEVVKHLLGHKADVTVSNKTGWTPLNVAASGGHVEVVKHLMEHGADATIANSDGATPLYTAARNGHLAVVKHLLGHKADVTVSKKNGWTPLNAAAEGGHLEVVKYLIRHGADVAMANNDGVTPLYSASRNGHLVVVEYLIEHKADVTMPNKNGWTPLNAAAEFGHLEVVEYFMKHEGKTMALTN